jgi:hypothetical protein
MDFYGFSMDYKILTGINIIELAADGQSWIAQNNGVG